MSNIIKEKSGLRLVLEALFSSSNEEKDVLKKQIEEVKKMEDVEHIRDLVKLVEAPSVKEARFNTDNIKAKFSNNTRVKRGRTEQVEVSNNTRVTADRTDQEEKSLDEI